MTGDAGIAGGSGMPQRPERGTAVRLKQLSFGSQMKAVLTLALPTAAIFFVLLLMLELFGVLTTGHSRHETWLVLVLALAIVSLILAGFIAVVQIAALGLLHALPGRGPKLNLEEPGHLAGIFE